jgi:hypothetical protein
VAAAADRETERLRDLALEEARLDAEEEEYNRGDVESEESQQAVAVAVEPKTRVTRTPSLSPEDAAAMALLEQLRKDMNAPDLDFTTLAEVAQPDADVEFEAPVAEAHAEAPVEDAPAAKKATKKATAKAEDTDAPAKPKKAPAKKKSEE